MKTRLFLVSATLLIASLGSMVGRAQDATPMTAAEHASLAQAYQAEAKQAQEKVAQHQLMLSRYKNAPTLQKGLSVPTAPMVAHCQKLVDSYKQVASEAGELAKIHRQAASSTQAD